MKAKTVTTNKFYDLKQLKWANFHKFLSILVTWQIQKKRPATVEKRL